MNKVLFIAGLACLAIGCSGGQWAREGADSQAVQSDYSECQTMGGVQPPPATLADKIGANPDMSSMAIEKCMRGKGYQWETEKAKGQ